MHTSRRTFLAGTAAALGGAAVLTPGVASAAPGDGTAGLDDDIRKLFRGLPGTTTYKIVAPPARGDKGLSLSQDSAKRVFVGSAIKTFILCEALRQADGADVVSTISAKELPLNEDVWTLDSATFNPPNLTGTVSERTALEAMIMHSDNTGTDMALKLAGPANVRKFISSIGLKSTQIPDSTRSFFGYLLGAPDYLTFTWAELLAATDAPLVNPPLNGVETLASSADDFVSYYQQALQGKFFKNAATLTEFRRILSLGDAIYLVPLPSGVQAFLKGGSIDVPGFHALCIPGAMFFDDRWVYFCIDINWNAAAESDPATVTKFLSAASTALARVKDALATKRGGR